MLGVWQQMKKLTGLSDMGYKTYLGVVYFFSFDSIWLVRILKALFSAYTCVLVYKLAGRNFGESTARLTAVFCMLMPNLIYYCGLHLKEVEMLFLIVLFVERSDYILRIKKIPIFQTILVVIIGLSLFTLRTVLGAVAFMALFSAMMFSSGKVLNWSKKLVLSFFVLLLLAIGLGESINQEVGEYWEARTENQSNNMEWRSKRKSGNEFTKYGSVAIFAPMIFTAPLPTMVNIETQENQMMLHGGNYVKNITSFFTIIAIFLLFYKGEWRLSSMPLFFLIGYLAVISLSGFAISERFHLPALPFNLMFAAYGISQVTNKHKRWFNVWLIFIFVAIVGWSWFKLAGRGIV